MGRRRAGGLTAALLVAAGAWASAQGGRITREEALAAVYPGATVAAERVFLTRAQQTAIRELAGVDVESRLVARYVATKDGVVVGRAYVDTHVVRTKRESLLIALHADGTVKRIDVTAFLEPSEYRPSERWLAQYDDRPLNDDLAMRRAIRAIAGATLTGLAANGAARRALATDRVLTGDVR